MELSIAIIVCKRDAAGTERTLQNLKGIAADIFLYDTTNTDHSRKMAFEQNVRLVKGDWEGYEQVRYKAAQFAKHDWILMLHTGEELSEVLKDSLQKLDYTPKKVAYRVGFRNFFDKKWMRYGEWSAYTPVRIANRGVVKTYDNRVNESIFLKQGIRIQKLKGYILHSTFKDKKELSRKVIRDALLAAIKYYRQGRRTSFISLFASPVAAFIQNYFFKLGFLDGRQGYFCARMGARYSFLKHARLRELLREFRKPL